MSWRVRYSRIFYKELAKLPRSARQRIESVAFGEEIADDPFLGGKVQKLTGYSDYYKLRVGAYRIGLRIDTTERLVEFRRVLHRKDIYRNFP
jgi:mRNA interferase RelE/StbE